MNNFLRLSLLAVLIPSGVVCAQTTGTDLPGVPPPQPPLVARAPAKASWTIEIKPVDKGPVSHASIPSLPLKYLKRQVWTKSNQFMRCDSEWTDGTKTEDWVAGRLKFFQDPQLKGIHFQNPQSDPSNHDFGASDFEMLDWLGLDDYVGGYTYAGQKCYLFEAKELASQANGQGPNIPNKTLRQISAPGTPTKVYISIQTKLPVAIIDGAGEYQFHYLAPPEDKLVMPEPYASMWKVFNSHP